MNWDRCLFGLLFASMAFIFGLFIYLIVDSSFIEDEHVGYSVVVDKGRTPPWVQTIDHGNGVIQSIYHDEIFHIYLNVDSRTCGVAVSEDRYHSVNFGERFDVVYKNGRLSGNLYITEVAWKGLEK